MKKWQTIVAGAILVTWAGVVTGQTPEGQKPATTTTTRVVKTTVAGGSGLKVLVDGKPIEFRDAQPMVIMGATMVPMRGIFEAIGAYVEYDPVTHTVKARRNNESVDLTMGSRLAHKNGAEILMQVKPQVIQGTTMVPLRFISEALGARVEFDKPNNTVTVTTSS